MSFAFQASDRAVGTPTRDLFRRVDVPTARSPNIEELEKHRMFNDYTLQSPTTDPGELGSLFADLPTDLAGIAQVAQGLIYHYMAGPYIYGWNPPKERLAEINTRHLNRILASLLEKDARPLTEPRAMEERFIGCCRDFSLLACAILRQQGQAARLRYGFANYFAPGYWGDHVIVEVWQNDRWQRFDPQFAGQPGWDFSLLDMPPEVFATGGRAWQMCRTEGADADRFGLGPEETFVRGWWFVRSRLQLDVAALNKLELLCWDSIDGLHETVPADVAMLDEMAVLSLEPDSTALRHRCTTDPRWQLPTTVTCFHPAIGPAFPVEVA